MVPLHMQENVSENTTKVIKFIYSFYLLEDLHLQLNSEMLLISFYDISLVY